MLILVALCALQSAGPAEEAYAALRVRDYDRALAAFERAIAAAPRQAGLRKDLAYTYLKTGENEAAREQFAEALRLDAADEHVALEYAFLCYETSRQAEARRIFDRLRASKDPAVRATAGRAFQNIDRPLQEGIARWSAAVARLPRDFSAHLELARLAERRNELDLAAESYLKAWRLRPAERSLLLDLGRVWSAQGRTEQATAALLAAARGSPPRVAEAARELLPRRPPSAAELRAAQELDSGSSPLPLTAASVPDAKDMAGRSYRLGYLPDALRYLQAAYELDPLDFSLMLKLGWTYNLLKQNQQAARWFDLARRSPDPRIVSEANQAWRNLRPSLTRFHVSAWAFPFFSSRWSDVFSYAQVKTEMRLGWLQPYLSLRFIGDTRRKTGTALPQYLSESAIIAAAGLATRSRRGVVLWGEAGTAISYLDQRGRGRRLPDYRGGLNWSRGAGRLFSSEAPGWFAETANDAVFLSRFANDFLLYSQNRSGYTLPGLFRAQLYANANFTADVRRQDWANFIELGPGVRFRWEGLPESLVFSVNLLYGIYTMRTPRPNYFDLRAGFWYAFTR